MLLSDESSLSMAAPSGAERRWAQRVGGVSSDGDVDGDAADAGAASSGG